MTASAELQGTGSAWNLYNGNQYLCIRGTPHMCTEVTIGQGQGGQKQGEPVRLRAILNLGKLERGALRSRFDLLPVTLVHEFRDFCICIVQRRLVWQEDYTHVLSSGLLAKSAAMNDEHVFLLQ
jgi:hypothetical protein